MQLDDMFDANSVFGGQRQQQQQQQQQQQMRYPEAGFLNGSLSLPLGLNNGSLITARLEQMLLELDRLIRTSGISSCALLPPNHDICLLMRQIPLVISQSTTPRQTMFTFVEKVVYMLYKSNTAFALEAYTGFLQSLFELSVDVAKEIMAWIVHSDDERKFNAPVVAMLMRHELVPLEEYDVHLAKLIRNPETAESVSQFAANLLSNCLLSPNPVTFLEDHTLTIAALRELVVKGTAPSSVVMLLHELESQVKIPYQLTEKGGMNCFEIRMLLAEWARLCQYPMAGPQVYKNLAKKILKITRDDEGHCFFFRLCTETCVEHYLSFKALTTTFQKRAAQLIDAYGKLVAHMVRLQIKNTDDGDDVPLARRAFSVVILILAKYHEKRSTNFNQRPFLRILSSLYCELTKIRTAHVQWSILRAYSETLHTLQPGNFPGFAFSWLQLVSHRMFVPQLLTGNDRNKGWLICQKLVLVLLQFLSPLLDRQALQKATRQFYRGTLRFLVVLLHDFPEFLCENYMVFVQVIPPSCIQLRNLVLSAFPRVMHLPDPFTADLRMDRLREFQQDPVLDTSYIKLLDDRFQAAIDAFVKSPSKRLYDVVLDRIVDQEEEKGQGRIRTDVLGAFVLYIGSKTTLSNDSFIDQVPATIAYKELLSRMTPKGRYLLLNAIADHLRYPNNHTYFFRAALLHLFDTQPEVMKEQITRVLLERLIVNRPHPWGLLATFIDLIKKPSFWDHEFIRCAPDIERLFDNVSRSIKRTI